METLRTLPGDDVRQIMKLVIDLPPDCPWKVGTVLHTIGYPEPEIFGFLYVLPGGVASLGIFMSPKPANLS